MGMYKAATGAGVRAWARPSMRLIAGMALCVAITTFPFGTVAGASTPTKALFAYYNLHPCMLVTQSQVKNVFRVPVGPGQATPSRTGGGQCRYDTKGPLANGDLGTIVYGFSQGTAVSEKYYNPGGSFVNEPSVGHGAFCEVKGTDVGSLYANVGTYGGSSQNLNFGGDNSCADSVKFAKDAFAHLA